MAQEDGFASAMANIGKNKLINFEGGYFSFDYKLGS